jgi:hypothetical protein
VIRFSDSEFEFCPAFLAIDYGDLESVSSRRQPIAAEHHQVG